jgi:histidinol-phosphate aminotransferase
MNLFRENILKTSGYVPGEQPLDSATIKLNTNENPYPPSPRVMEAVAAVSAEQLRRYPSPNGKSFRDAAAQVHGIPPDWILPFNGGDELLSVAIRAAAGEHDAVAYLEPSYSLYPVLTELNGSPAIKLSYKIDDSSSDQIGNRKSGAAPAIENPIWQLPFDIEKTPAKILLIVNPNAPSGHLDPIGRLAEIAAGFKGLLVIDEAYVDFAPASALELVKKFNNVLLLRTMSKGYSLAGLRFGYGIAQPTLMRQLEKVRDSYPVDAISIAAATAAIQDQPYARSTWEKVKTERTRVSIALRQMGFQLPDSHTNFVLATVPPKVTGRGVYESLKSRGILIRWWDLPRIADKVRITIGTPEQNDRLLTELQN